MNSKPYTAESGEFDENGKFGKSDSLTFGEISSNLSLSPNSSFLSNSPLS